MKILRTAFLALSLGAFGLGATACGGSDTETDTMPEDPAMGDDTGADEGGMDDMGENPCGGADDFGDDMGGDDMGENPCGGAEDMGDTEEEDW